MLTLHARAAQTFEADTPFVFFRGDEWPIDGGALKGTYNRWRAEQVATQRVARYPDSPHTVEWLVQARRLADAFEVVERIVPRHPTRIAAAFEALTAGRTDIQMDQSRGYQARLRGLLDATRLRLPTLDGELAADIEFALLPHDRILSASGADYEAQLKTVVDRYPETTAARLALVDLAQVRRPSTAALAELDAIAARQPGSIVAAKARYTKAFQLAMNGSGLVRDGADADPTDRILEVLAIVQELESGRYPPCDWVEKAPDLVVQFSLLQSTISAANAVRLLEGLRQFIRTHQSMLQAPDGYALAYAVPRKLPSIAAFLPDGAAAMERLFATFAQEWSDKAAAPYLKAMWFGLLQQGMPWPVAVALPSPTQEADIRALLATAGAAERDSTYARRALARLAEREFGDPASLALAHAHFSEYGRRFGASSGAWLAAVRLGQVAQAQGQPAEAARRFAEVARTNAGEPMVRALALAYAARASEAAGDFAAALPHYRAAFTAWTPDLGETLSLDLPPPRSPGMSLGPRTPNSALVARADVERRGRELARSQPLDGGQELERGRWLLAQARSREAAVVLQSVAARHARTAVGAEARAVLTRARLDAALALADTTTAASFPSVDGGAALTELDALATEPFDASTGMAGIIGATLRLIQGNEAEADVRLAAALRRWVTEGTRLRAAPQPGSLAHDVLAVRDAVFLPMGGALLGGGWNASVWPKAMPQFLVAQADLRILVEGGGVATTVDVSRQPSGLTNVLFISSDDAAYITRAVSRLGGTQRREPTAIMEVPNQPIGDAQTIVRWWNQYFPARPGHWTGFEIHTYPAFASIEFTDAARTRALVPITVGYAGATVVLEKVNGVWTMTALVNRWIT